MDGAVTKFGCDGEVVVSTAEAVGVVDELGRVSIACGLGTGNGERGTYLLPECLVKTVVVAVVGVPTNEASIACIS